MANHILLLTDSIGQEGTGRFITHLANGLSAKDGVKVTLLLLHTENQLFNKDISANVNIVHLNLTGRIRYSMPSIVKKIIDIRPDVCFVLYTQLVLMSYFAPVLRKEGIKMVFRETIIPSMYRGNANALNKMIVRHSYRLYDSIVAQSNDMAKDLVEKWKCDRNIITIINNPVSLDKIQGMIMDVTCPIEFVNRDKPIFVSAGRLNKQKGYDIIIERLSELKSIPFKYYILGEGEERQSLEKQIKDNNLTDTVFLLGFKDNPYVYLQYSDALILSSRYEGFPNIVLEANSIGKPVFSNLCPGGVNEIIKNGENGVACDFENPLAFQKGLSDFLHSNFETKKIKDMTSTRYGFNIIMDKYVAFINKLVKA